MEEQGRERVGLERLRPQEVWLLGFGERIRFHLKDFI